MITPEDRLVAWHQAIAAFDVRKFVWNALGYPTRINTPVWVFYAWQRDDGGVAGAVCWEPPEGTGGWTYLTYGHDYNWNPTIWYQPTFVLKKLRVTR